VPGLRCPEEDGVVVAAAPVAVLVGALEDGAVVVLGFVPFILIYNYSNIQL